MSGAPAIYYNRDGKINTGSLHYKGSEPITIFHGIYVGRIGSTSEFEAQLGKVWKRKVIDEIIDGRIFDFLPEELILSDADILQAIDDNWPETNSDYANMVLDKKTSYRHIFLQSVMKEINGRANKDDVLSLILNAAGSRVGKKS